MASASNLGARPQPKMLWVYRFLMTTLAPLAIVGLCVRGFRNSAYWQRWSERFGFVPSSVVEQGPFDLWLHAVSVGEARAAAPLVRRLREDYPHLKILITTTTPTGSAMVTQMLGSSVAHCYFPYDLGGSMRRFAVATKPRLGLIMETEIWPEMISQIKAVGTHLMYTNVRLSERSYTNYARFKELISYTLAPVDFFAAQGKADAQHLEQLGVDQNKIAITGSIKFDVQIPASMLEMAEVTRRQLGSDRLIWIAGSTRDGEEGRILESYKVLKADFPHLLLVIVPRHPERFDYVARKTARRGLKVVRRTEGAPELENDVDVYLGDTMGELSLLYASSDVAFVGGSLEPFGGQNILEPCALGVPVLFGPHMFNFPDISKWTIREGAGLMVHNSAELIDELRDLLGNASRRDRMGRRGLDFIEAHRGALDKNIDLLKPILKQLEQS